MTLPFCHVEWVLLTFGNDFWTKIVLNIIVPFVMTFYWLLIGGSLYKLYGIHEHLSIWYLVWTIGAWKYLEKLMMISRYKFCTARNDTFYYLCISRYFFLLKTTKLNNRKQWNRRYYNIYLKRKKNFVECSIAEMSVN